MEKNEFIKSAARVVAASLGMALVSAADEAANHEHSPKQRRKNIAGWAVLGAVCQGVMEVYYHSTKKKEQ